MILKSVSAEIYLLIAVFPFNCLQEIFHMYFRLLGTNGNQIKSSQWNYSFDNNSALALSLNYSQYGNHRLEKLIVL